MPFRRHGHRRIGRITNLTRRESRGLQLRRIVSVDFHILQRICTGKLIEVLPPFFI